MVYLKNDFENQLKRLNPTDFEMKSYFGVIRFENKNKNILQRISIGFNEYFPHSALISGVSATIIFPKIEDILQTSYKKAGLKKNDNSTIGKVFQDMQEINYDIFDTDINNEETFQIVAKEVKKIIKKGALPFFEKYNNIENVANLFSNLKPQEVVPYIRGAQLFVKTILILKEANHPKYTEKRDDFYKVLKVQANKKEVYKQQLILFNELFFKSK